jgi:hypothetical protein
VVPLFLFLRREDTRFRAQSLRIGSIGALAFSENRLPLFRIMLRPHAQRRRTDQESLKAFRETLLVPPALIFHDKCLPTGKMGNNSNRSLFRNCLVKATPLANIATSGSAGFLVLHCNYFISNKSCKRSEATQERKN